MKHKLYIILITLLSWQSAYSQPENESSLTWEDFVLLMADDYDDEGYGPDSELFEELYYLHAHPMNLNDIKEEDLRLLPFLSENEIKDIMWYIDNHKPLMSTGELMFIYSLDKLKRSMIQLFCYAGEYKHNDYSLRNIWKYSNNELVLRTDIPFYTKAGYQKVPDSVLISKPNKIYQGNRFFHSIRYTFSSQNHFFAGFQAEKDPGEKNIDHIAGYAMVKDIGIIRNAILGNYRVSFGHGLVVNTSSSFGKAMKISSMEVIDKGITKHSSTTETGYFSGGATTLSFGKVNVSAYVSYKKSDATFNSDSIGLSSLKTDGLHRTELERSKKNNISLTDLGTNIHLDLKSIQLSLTSAYTHINVPLAPKCNTEGTYYKMYYPQGQDFSATSLAYSYRKNNLVFSGETAVNSKGAIATLNQLQWKINSFNTVTLIQRRYGAKYSTINARTFSENSSPQNENGIYLGWQSLLSEKISINSYIDAMYFPWLKYQVYGSSYGIEAFAQLNYNINTKNTLIVRYKLKSKEKDYKYNNGSSLKFKTTHNLRIQHNMILTDNWSLRTTFNTSLVTFVNNKNFGFNIGETVRYAKNKKYRFDASIIYFNTDSYDSRIYNFESSLLYAFAMNSYYYKGIRSTFLASINLTEKLSITTKFSSTVYFNQETIGSALEQINSNNKEDLQLQLRWKF